MSDKEKLLAIVVAGTVIMLGGMFGAVKMMDAFDSRNSRIKQLDGEIARRETAVRKGKAAKSKLKGEYSQRSLPSDAERARADYADWLIATKEKHFSKSSYKAVGEEVHPDVYRQLSYDVDAVGTLNQLVEFLHEFYSMNTLHRIKELDIKPLGADTRDLKLVVKLEALAIADAPDGKNAVRENEAATFVGQLTAAAGSWSVTPATSVAVAGAQLGAARPTGDGEAMGETVVDGLSNKLWLQAASNKPPLRLRAADKELVDYKRVILSRNLFGQANQVPEIDRISAASATTNKPYSVTVDASDPDEIDDLTFYLDEAPPGAELDPESGRLRWTPDKAGEYSFKLSVKDNGWPIASASREFTIRVEDEVIVRAQDPPPPDTSPTIEAHQTVVTAILKDRTGTWRAWLDVRLRETILRLAVGDEFDIGNVAGTIREIRRKEIVVEIDGQLWLFAKGESITQGVLVGEAESSDVSGIRPDELKR